MLLDSGFSPDDVAHMRRQFYEGRGEEVPDDVNTGDLSESYFFFSFFFSSFSIPKPKVEEVHELIYVKS